MLFNSTAANRGTSFPDPRFYRAAGDGSQWHVQEEIGLTPISVCSDGFSRS